MREINICEEEVIHYIFIKSLASVAKDWIWKIIFYVYRGKYKPPDFILKLKTVIILQVHVFSLCLHLPLFQPIIIGDSIGIVFLKEEMVLEPLTIKKTRMH